MATNKERTSSAAMRKLLLQSASKKEQEIQQIGSVAESTIPQPAIEHPIHEEVKESAPVKETVQEPQPEQMEKPESKPSVQSSPKTEESKVCGKKFSEYLEERKLKNTEVIRISSETHRKLKQIAMATGLGMHNIANNILEDILTSHNKEIQAILKKYMSIPIRFLLAVSKRSSSNCSRENARMTGSPVKISRDTRFRRSTSFCIA